MHLLLHFAVHLFYLCALSSASSKFFRLTKNSDPVDPSNRKSPNPLCSVLIHASHLSCRRFSSALISASSSRSLYVVDPLHYRPSSTASDPPLVSTLSLLCYEGHLCCSVAPLRFVPAPSHLFVIVFNCQIVSVAAPAPDLTTPLSRWSFVDATFRHTTAALKTQQPHRVIPRQIRHHPFCQNSRLRPS